MNVIGTLGTSASDERTLIGPIVIITGARAPLTPVGMPNRSVGGGDLTDPTYGVSRYGVTGAFGLNNIGILVKT